MYIINIINLFQIEGKNKLNELKEFCNKNEINKTFVSWAKKLILHHIPNQNYLICPLDILELIIPNIQKVLKFSDSKMKNYINIVNSFIQFSICEYSIYKKYNQFIITIASLLIGISSDFEENELNEEENQKNRNLIKNYFKEFNFLDLSMIEECEKEIVFLIDNSSDEDEQDYEFTRPNSICSDFLNSSEKFKDEKNSYDYYNRFSTASNDDFLDEDEN